MMKPKLLKIVMVFLTLLPSFGCSRKTPVRSFIMAHPSANPTPPLPANRIIGVWTSDEVGSIVFYKEEGAALYDKGVDPKEASKSRSLEWHLDGDHVLLEDNKNSREADREAGEKVLQMRLRWSVSDDNKMLTLQYDDGRIFGMYNRVSDDPEAFYSFLYR